MAEKITIADSIKKFYETAVIAVVENVDADLVKAEFEKVVKEAVPKIQKMIQGHNDCKIGKSGSIDKRFDKTYRDEGFVELVPIACCKYKEVMDMVETYLIKYFKAHVINGTDLEVGNRTYSGDYWIYVVHKGAKPNDEPTTK
jgi:hypothetical protein